MCSPNWTIDLYKNSSNPITQCDREALNINAFAVTVGGQKRVMLGIGYEVWKSFIRYVTIFSYQLRETFDKQKSCIVNI